VATQSATGGGAASSGADGLRQRKKDRTRQLLREGGARLFAERGFAGTTVADIAEYADVSTRTFFRYFESKEALLLPDSAELFAYVEDALAARPASEEPLRAVCRALTQAAEPFAASSLTALTHPLEAMESVVTARLVQAFVEFEDSLTALVRRRLGPAQAGPDAEAGGESDGESDADLDLRAAVIAGAALSAVRALLRTSRARRLGGSGYDGEPTLSQAFEYLYRLDA
jgi:AcrR family transcriptional regulator